MALEDMTGVEIVERLVELGETRRPASPALVDQVLAEVGLPPAPLYRELLSRTDGLEKGPLCFLNVKKKGSYFLGKLDVLYDPYLPVAFIGGTYYGWHREEKCWCRSTSNPISERYPDEEAMFRAIAASARGFVPHVYVPARQRRVVPLADLVASVPAGRVKRPRAVSARDRVHRVFRRAVKVSAPDDYRAFFDLCDGFEVNGMMLYGVRRLVEAQADVVREGYVEAGIMDDLALVYSAWDSQWQLVDIGAYEPDCDDERYQTFTEMIGTILPQRLV